MIEELEVEVMERIEEWKEVEVKVEVEVIERGNSGGRHRS